MTADRDCANHQERVVWAQHGAMSRTVERRDVLARLLAEPGLTLDQLVEGFLAPPLYSHWIGSPSIQLSTGQSSDGSTVAGLERACANTSTGSSRVSMCTTMEICFNRSESRSCATELRSKLSFL